MTYLCDGCQQLAAVKPGLCARCAQPRREPKHPGVLRAALGFLVFYGAACRFDHTLFAAALHHAELLLSVHLMWLGALVMGWGIHRIERGPTRQALRGYFAVFVAKRYLRRADAHQRRMRRVL